MNEKEERKILIEAIATALEDASTRDLIFVYSFILSGR